MPIVFSLDIFPSVFLDRARSAARRDNQTVLSGIRDNDILVVLFSPFLLSPLEEKFCSEITRRIVRRNISGYRERLIAACSKWRRSPKRGFAVVESAWNRNARVRKFPNIFPSARTVEPRARKYVQVAGGRRCFRQVRVSDPSPRTYVVAYRSGWSRLSRGLSDRRLSFFLPSALLLFCFNFANCFVRYFLYETPGENGNQRNRCG